MKAVAVKPTYLYRCFDRHGVLLYVGVTDNQDDRMRAHAADKFWWGDVHKITNMAFETREQALWAEWAVISTCHPLHNKKVSPPVGHQCPTPKSPPPALPIDGHIYMLETFAEIKANSAKYDALHRQMDDLFAEAGVSRT